MAKRPKLACWECINHRELARNEGIDWPFKDCGLKGRCWLCSKPAHAEIGRSQCLNCGIHINYQFRETKAKTRQVLMHDLTVNQRQADGMVEGELACSCGLVYMQWRTPLGTAFWTDTYLAMDQHDAHLAHISYLPNDWLSLVTDEYEEDDA